MSRSSVSVIITTYHRPVSLLKKALESALAQTAPAQEILIVDDNETGSALSAQIRELCGQYEGVEYIKQDGNTGPSAARNAGARRASGQFLAFLDDDDLWMPEKLEKQLLVFEHGSPALGLVYCHGIQRDQSGDEHDYYNLYSRRTPAYLDMLGFDEIGSTSGPLIRKSCFDDAGGFWEGLPSHEDYELWIRISKKYAIDCAAEKLFVYNTHDGEHVSGSKANAYLGQRDIYLRYRRDLRRYPDIRIRRLNNVIRRRPAITPEVLFFAAERLLVRVMKHLHRS